jgi:hypothetical protein
MAIDRPRLSEAIREPFGSLEQLGIPADLISLCIGGLDFLISGENGVKLADEELIAYAADEGALSGLLWWDLDTAWQGFVNGEEIRQAWQVCDRVAAAFCECLNTLLTEAV